MSRTADNTASVQPEKKSSKIGSILLTLLIAIGILTVKTFFSERSNHQTTVQNILDKDPDYNNLLVDSVTFPYFVSIPFSDIFMDNNLIPNRYKGSFTVKHKDAKPLPASCDGYQFGYAMRLAEDNQMHLSIDADNMNKLVPCNR